MASTNAQEVCSNASFPFTFYNVNRSVETGVFNDDGLCIFPTANCGSDVAIQDCCQALPELTITGSNYMFIAFAFILIPIVYAKYLAKTPEERDADKHNRIPDWVKRIPSRLFQKLFTYGLPVYITAQVMVPIYMRQSLQERLDVSSRNTLIAAEAFIVPYSAIFQFIEDIVLVRVNYALASGNKPLTNNLVHAGMVGSFATGFLAATLATILGVIPPVLQGLTNPGLSNDLSLYPDCDFVTDGNSNVLPYWLMKVWALPGTQVGMVLSGFMFGALELDTLGWLGGIALGMIPLIWFTTVNNSTNRLLLLAGAEFTSAWALPILAIVFICSPLGAELREHTGFKLELSKLHKSLLVTFLGGNDDIMTNDDSNENVELEPANSDKNYGTDKIDQEEQLHGETETCGSAEDQVTPTSSPPPEPESTKDLLKDGLKIMAMDVAIQFCISLSVYLALLKDAAIGYQLTALQSALPTYGIAYALGMGIVLKVVGPRYISSKQYVIFATFARITVGCAFLLVPLIVGAVIPFRTNLAFDYGGNACAYAKDSQCLPFFTKIFGPNGKGGDFTLPFTFDVFAMGASVEAVFFILRAALLACVDLDFMLWSTAGAVLVYIPAIIVAVLVPPFGSQAIAFFVAMYIPQVVLIVLFSVRLEVLIRRKLKGVKGSWSRRLSVSRSTQFVTGGQL
jgi:hypothetical protein